ncbi:MAG: hypothetical protein M3Y35_00540, partial [Actinomycetota bacterium]|nr:hypothetical protein [Actinomycetota bacterium]
VAVRGPPVLSGVITMLSGVITMLSGVTVLLGLIEDAEDDSALCGHPPALGHESIGQGLHTDHRSSTCDDAHRATGYFGRGLR